MASNARSIRNASLAVITFILTVVFVDNLRAEGQADVGPSKKSALECSSCFERKKGMCADECTEVPPIHQRECQLRCIKEYCNHRCTEEAPQFIEFQTQACEDCLNEQFVLCEKQCPTGTPRAVAECKVRCSAANCQAGCR